MKLKDRIAAWVIFGRVAKALGLTRAQFRRVLAMQPFPKWVGHIATLVAVATAAYTSLHPGAALPTWIITLTALINYFTHSATGTGGK